MSRAVALHQLDHMLIEELTILLVMHVDEVTITVDLHAGHEKGTAWGCDLSYDYVKINALYHT